MERRSLVSKWYDSSNPRKVSLIAANLPPCHWCLKVELFELSCVLPYKRAGGKDTVILIHHSIGRAWCITPLAKTGNCRDERTWGFGSARRMEGRRAVLVSSVLL